MQTLIAYFKRQSMAARIAILGVSIFIVILVVNNLSAFIAYIT